jgi:DNA-binding SARP family transcriptional activator
VPAPRCIRLLGRPNAGGVHLRGNKPWAITAYLALADAPVPRARIISLLFGGAQDPAAALRWNLGQVRRLLGRPGALSGPVLSLPDDGVRFDVGVLAAARWQDAVELEGLGVELLEGMQFPSCAAFETWLTGERRRFAALAEAVLQEATLNALSVGNLGDGAGYASRLVTLNPLADTHQELLIRAYAMSGDLPAARRQLESAVRLFRRELGCDPQPSVFLAAEAGPAKADGASTPARVRALLEAGQAQVTAGAMGAAVQVLRAACDEADGTRDAALAATAHLALGSALIGAGTARHQEGEIALQRAINLARESGHRATAAAAYRNLAGSDVLRGIYPRADRRLAEAESLGSGEASEVVEVAAIRGVGLLDRGDIDAAIAVFRHGLDADPGREHGFLPIMLSHAGRACLLAGDFPAARGHLDQALQIAQTRSWAGVTAAPLALLGHVAVATGELVAAGDLLEEALARACQVGDPCWETWAAHGLGLHAAASGDPGAALHHLADAVTRSRPARGGHLWSHVWALTDAARLGRRLGDPRHAAWQEEALTTAQRCGMRALTSQLLQVPSHQELAYGRRPGPPEDDGGDRGP